MAMQSDLNKKASYEMPDGQQVKLAPSHIVYPKAYFTPQLLGCDQPGVHRVIHDCLQGLGTFYNSAVGQSVVLVGGSTQFRGFARRLRSELNMLAGSVLQRPQVIDLANRDQSGWLGGKILATLNSFEQVRVSRSEYEEVGARIVH